MVGHKTQKKIIKKNRKTICRKNRYKQSWDQQLLDWEKGRVLQYPSWVEKRFFYETLVCKKDLRKIEYQDAFIETDELDKNECSPASFQAKFKTSKNRWVSAFPSLSGGTTLVVPMPRSGRCFASIKDFIDNATLEHQKHFWKRAAREIRKAVSSTGRVYVSTHGLAVPYFHLRIDTEPKYYKTEIFC